MFVNSIPQGKLSLIDILKQSEYSKITWNYHIYVANGDIRAEKNIRIWVKHGAVWQCEFHTRFPLHWTIGYYQDGVGKLQYTDYYNEYLSINRDAIQFNGGFLEIDDPGLISPLQNVYPDIAQSIKEISALWADYPVNKFDPEEFKNLWDTSRTKDEIEEQLYRYIQNPKPLFPLGTGKPVERSNPVGRNIHLEIEFASELTKKQFQPLFYFPQDDIHSQAKISGQIYAGEWSDGKTNLTYWQIEEEPYSLWVPYQLNGMHKLTISQDANWTDAEQAIASKKDTYFEAYANATGLHSLSKIPVAKNEFSFSSGPRKFYIGAGLKQPLKDTIESEPVADQVFRGKIRRVFFDPGSDCPGCIP